jgi:serine/threonine protein kinase/tetratricopeptide (TPR) repeat protein
VRLGEAVAGRFELVKIARTGGMAAVYHARDRQTGQPVAIKLLRRDWEDDDAERFRSEAELLAGLQHPGIVRYVHHGQGAGGELYLALEWLDGEDLGARLQRGTLSLDETLQLISRVAEALGAAHARGIVHRDIKPSNLFLVDGRVDRVKLLDFGIARPVLASARSAPTRTGIVVGTPMYMAPEQARGHRQLDARADIFALGCVLYACLAGESPFTGDDPLSVLARILLEEAPLISSVLPTVPPEIEELGARMLSKDPAGRPADGAAVVRELGSLTDLAPTSTRVKVPSLTRIEKRLVFVVFVSNADSHLSPLDPQRPRTVRYLASALDDISATVTGHGGHLERLADGSAVVTVAGSGAATDLAARAARCALAIRAAVPDLAIALATAWESTSQRSAIGQVIDRAVGLLRGGSAPAREPEPLLADAFREPLTAPIHLDELTAGLLDARFVVDGDELGLHLRGESELTESVRTLLGRPSPCVGRERDLAVLGGFLEECVNEPMARAVLVTGPAGVGKSRVRHELLERNRQRERPMEVWLGRGDPLRADSLYGILAPAIRWAVGIRSGEPLVAQRRKLRARVGRHLQFGEPQRVAEFVGELIGVPFEDGHSMLLRAARHDATLMGDQIRHALEDWLVAETAVRPLLVVLEDLHWGDAPSVKLVSALLGKLAERPFMVLAFARPEVLERFPRLWADRGVQEVRLGQLTPKASARLIKVVLGDAVSDEMSARMVERAEGNAFFLEELIRAVAEGKQEGLPETVLAMVQARLENLNAEARRLLRAAAVFGEVFWYGGVTSLLGGERSGFAACLRDLVEREVIGQVPEGKFPGEVVYRFRHALVRDAAYALLTEEDRRLGHQLAGQWLEQAGEADQMVLAGHYEGGGNLPRAATCYRLAAEQARDGNDHSGVLARVERSIRCGSSGLQLGLLRLLQAEAHKWRGEAAEGLRYAREAMALVPRHGSEFYQAIGEVVAASGKLGRLEVVEEMAEQLLEMPPSDEALGAWAAAAARASSQLVYAGRADLADRLLLRLEDLGPGLERLAGREPAVLAWVYEAHAIRFGIVGGDPSGRLRMAMLARTQFEQASDVRNAALQACNLANGYLEVGQYEQGESEFRSTLQSAMRMGLHNVTSLARTLMAHGVALSGDLDEAESLARTASEAWRSQGNERMEGWSRTYFARILTLARKLDEAEAEARRAIELLRVSPPLRVAALASLAEVLLGAGRAREALESAEQALSLLTSLGRYEKGEALVRLVHAEALGATGADRAAVDLALDEASRRLLERARQISSEDWRRSFLERDPDNARTLALAREARASRKA